MEETQVLIVGGGVAGLVAAYHCEQAGLSPLIVDANAQIGGRVQTTEKDGFLLDHGFQVLLTNYEEARRYLDFKALELKHFNTGAIIFDESGKYEIADPLRDFSKLFSMAFSRVGSIQDKLLMFRLTQALKKQNRADLFKANDESTMSFLQSYGFSAKIIKNFFQPFFGGIFLENELKTPASMFRFVFKMFSEGSAAIPANGIGAIPEQLKGKLEKTRLQLNTRVKQVEGNEVQLENGEKISFQKLIIACDPGAILPNLAGQQLEYVNTCNLYYTSDQSILNSKSIALVPDADSLINNFCVLTDVATSYSKEHKSLVSVTLKFIPAAEDESFYQKIAEELQQLTDATSPLTFVHRFDIAKALPVIPDLEYSLQNTQFTLTDDIYLAGDYLLNASLDAAMRSGRLAAEAMIISLR